MGRVHHKLYWTKPVSSRTMCRCSPINRYLQPRFQGTSQQSFRIVPKQAHFFLILIINQSKYCTLHKITPSQPSKCHKIPNHLRAAHRHWNASLLFNNNKKSLFLNLVNQNILGEISNGHHSPPLYCTTQCPMMHCIRSSLLQTDGCSGTAC